MPYAMACPNPAAQTILMIESVEPAAIRFLMRSAFTQHGRIRLAGGELPWTRCLAPPARAPTASVASGLAPAESSAAADSAHPASITRWRGVDRFCPREGEAVDEKQIGDATTLQDASSA